MLEKNIIILILSTNNKSYDMFKSSQKKTWIKKMEERGIKCFFYEGGAKECKITGDTIKVNIPDDLENCSRKFIKTLETLKLYYPEVSMIYRTNLSSYIDVDNFLSYISSIEDKEDFYAGKKCVFNQLHANYFRLHCKLETYGRMIKSEILSVGYFTVNRFIESVIRNVCLRFFHKFNVEFASGSGFFLGINHFNKIISYEKLKYVDDVMVRLAVDKDIDSDIERFDYTKKFKFIEKDELEKIFHYRFKTENRDFDANLMMLIDDYKIREKISTRDNN